MQLVTDSIQQNLQKFKETVLSVPEENADLERDTGRDSFHSFESAKNEKQAMMATIICAECGSKVEGQNDQDCRNCGANGAMQV